MMNIQVGVVGAAVGVLGSVRIKMLTETDELFLLADKGSLSMFNRWGENLKFKLLDGGRKKDMLTAKFANCNNREDAARLTGSEIFIKKEDLPQLLDGEYYVRDLIGFSVIDSTNHCLGVISSFYNYGAGEMLEIEFTDSTSGKKTHFGFPFDNKIFGTIDINNKTIEANLPAII